MHVQFSLLLLTTATLAYTRFYLLELLDFSLKVVSAIVKVSGSELLFFTLQPVDSMVLITPVVYCVGALLLAWARLVYRLSSSLRNRNWLWVGHARFSILDKAGS